MNSRERVLTALGHQAPDRTPFAWGFGPTKPMAEVLQAWLAERGIDWLKLKNAVTDTLVIEPPYSGPAMDPGQPVYVGMWGIETRTASYGVGSYEEFVGHPLAGFDDPRALDDFPWPSAEWFDYTALPALVQGSTKAIQLSVGSAGNPLEIYTWMTGMEETMINIIVNPDLVCAALDRICSYFEAKLERCVAALNGNIDLLHFADDLGGQQGLLFSPATYRDVVQPFHRRLISHARDLAPQAKAMYHSDGAVFEIMPDLIDAGVEVLEAVQTDASGMEPERLKKAYGERICFHGGIPVQSLLPHGSVADVRRECRRLCDVLGENGGYIAAPTHAIQAGTPPENVWAMLETVLGEEVLGAVGKVRG
jgi:uroporphyrinogen decarboxylase